MKKMTAMKKTLACLCAACIAAGAFSASGRGEVCVSADENTSESEGSAEEAGSQFDTSVYTDKLQEIADEQAKIEKEIADANSGVMDETEKQKLIIKKIDNINQKADVINAYMTQLEMEISTEKEQAQQLKNEVDEGIAAYKKRLRAMYIAGDISYTEVLLNAGDFFDVLMRSELLKRVADYDAKTLDGLVAKKAKYDQKVAELEKEQADYDEQAAELEKERAELAELYNSSKEMKDLLKERQEQLAEKQQNYENEIYSYEGILSDLLKGTYGSSDDEVQRLQTEVQAVQKLTELRSAISERTKNGETIPDTECKYNFKWPVPGNYYVSSGVGARWGAYHAGLDIPGDGGTRVNAAEAGTVVRMNNSCTHNYGKDGSCGCGGGYGNFVVIDHGNGFLTLYGHLTQATVEVGDKVKQGDQIGLMGSTGYSTGTHLHFELRYEGYVTNPASFVSY